MRRFRQWLAETQDHMTESPDGGWAIYAEALADIEAAVKEVWDLAHEPAKCGHARANWKDPKYGTPEYQGEERCEACTAIEAVVEFSKQELIEKTKYILELEAEVKEITESRDYWTREWFLMEAIANKAKRQIVALTAELKSSKQIREAEKEILTKEISINAELRLENKRLRMVLQRIKDWPYDIMGDCVYDARKDAQDALKQGKEAG